MGLSIGVRDQTKHGHSASREHLLTTEMGRKGGGTHTPRSSPAKQSSVWDSLVPARAFLIKRTAATPCVLWGRESFQPLQGRGGGSDGNICSVKTLEKSSSNRLRKISGLHTPRPPVVQYAEKDWGIHEEGGKVDAE